MSEPWTSEWFHEATGRYYVRYDGRVRPRARVIMEIALGRPLRPDEDVHHRNEDKTDDRLENLQVLTSGEHTALHTRERWDAWHAANPNGWHAERPACSECGTTERPHFGRGLCRRCHSRGHARKTREARRVA